MYLSRMCNAVMPQECAAVETFRGDVCCRPSPLPSTSDQEPVRGRGDLKWRGPLERKGEPAQYLQCREIRTSRIS